MSSISLETAEIFKQVCLISTGIFIGVWSLRFYAWYLNKIKSRCKCYGCAIYKCSINPKNREVKITEEETDDHEERD